MIVIGYFFINTQRGDSNEDHKLKFYGELTKYVLYTHLFWSNNNLGIYHVYRKYKVFGMYFACKIPLSRKKIPKPYKTLT